MLSALIKDHEQHQQKSREKIKKLEQKTATLAAKYAKVRLIYDVIIGLMT